MKNCYNKQIISFDEGILDEVIDAIYIITMKNSMGRHQKVFKQLYKYKLSKTNIIIFNQGFKECKKELCNYRKKKCKEVKVSYEDLTHANQFIFQDSLTNNYSNILVLEDDFIFSDKLYQKDIIEDLKNIAKIYEKKKQSLVLRLGCIPILSFPSNYESF